MRLPAPLSRRNPHLNKNDFGHVLVVAGSPAMLGACALTSLAAMRAGAGLVTAAVASGLNLTLQKKIAHVVMTVPLPASAKDVLGQAACTRLRKLEGKFTCAAIGPGLGRTLATQRFVLRFVKSFSKPLVIDADALNALAGHAEVLDYAPAARILTPHAGEMSRLTGLPVPVIEADRKGVALAFARRYHCVVLLKGRRTVVASPEGKVYINRTGNVGLATAGSGDVLTGMIAAFLAQGIDPFRAACLGADLHGKTADLAAKKRSKAGLTALDLIETLPKLLKSL